MKYGVSINKNNNTQTSSPPPITEPALTLKRIEIVKAIKQLKYEKPTGPSNIKAEIIKARGEIFADLFTSKINKIVYERIIPADWTKSLFCCINKRKRHTIFKMQTIRDELGNDDCTKKVLYTSWPKYQCSYQKTRRMTENP